ncbi:hypothetical protein ABPG74_019289 [Tetrahymena malaccensis]
MFQNIGQAIEELHQKNQAFLAQQEAQKLQEQQQNHNCQIQNPPPFFQPDQPQCQASNAQGQYPPPPAQFQSQPIILNTQGQYPPAPFQQQKEVVQCQFTTNQGQYPSPPTQIQHEQVHHINHSGQYPIPPTQLQSQQVQFQQQNQPGQQPYAPSQQYPQQVQYQTQVNNEQNHAPFLSFQNEQVKIYTSCSSQHPPQFQPQQNFQPQNSFYGRSKLSMRQRYSEVIGKDNHLYSNYFDHFEQSNLDKRFGELDQVELKSITVYHTDNIIVGIQCSYQAGLNNFSSCSRGNYQGYVHASTIELQFGEHFESISGRCGDSIDRLEIKTNQRKLEVGGFGGQPFQNILQQNGYLQIKNFGGSTREFLDSFYVIYG